MMETAGHSAAAIACVEHGLAAGRNASTLLPAANTLHSTTAGPLWKTNADGTPNTGPRLPSWTLQNPYTFKAGLQDRATGWVKYGQRWYNAGTRRWTQMDTLDAPLDPANANRYAYATSDPINNSDPLGLATGTCVAAAVGVGATLVAAGAAAVGASVITGGAAAAAAVGAGATFVSGLTQLWGAEDACDED